MSIYVSIPCLYEDFELVKTIKNCKSKAKNPEQIYIGVAFIGNELFFKKTKEDLKEITNISYRYEKLENNIGVAKGRIFASSMYNDEDFFLQIDAHSRFINDWDEKLCNTLNEAKTITNNEKTILTGYAGEYFYDEDNIYVNTDLGYNSWLLNEFWIEDTIPKWEHKKIENISIELEKFIIKNKFAPASKVSAHFIFGNKNFAKNINLPENIIFWEEEIIQTIELIDDGFSIVHYGKTSPIYHLYYYLIKDKNGHRTNLSEVIILNDLFKIEEVNRAVKNNFLNYISNKENFYKIKNFENYSGIDIIKGPQKNNIFPKNYSNIGFIPVKHK